MEARGLHYLCYRYWYAHKWITMSLRVLQPMVTSQSLSLFAFISTKNWYFAFLGERKNGSVRGNLGISVKLLHKIHSTISRHQKFFTIFSKMSQKFGSNCLTISVWFLLNSLEKFLQVFFDSPKFSLLLFQNLENYEEGRANEIIWEKSAKNLKDFPGKLRLLWE